MVETHNDFAQRLKQLGRKHNKMTHGYTTKVTKDGLIVVKPRARRVRGMGGIKLLLIVAVGFIGFKAFTLASVGPVTYNERLSELQNGSAVEQVGAKVLAIDPVTSALVEGVSPAIR
ncbi:hypothetical protein Z945_1206 [Sulfitobacter noctilucae]|uniref:hypothetical protein n=1 Tax=Sulfitobacter noctilucae TaxID=1342302 RepID=UPI00046AF811|nr:hypothetical protein [Sulfitobacter noctilucae]KIN60238.1 hypothetical protein Z945_1206 [Sulfitobacter noctilucae]